MNTVEQMSCYRKLFKYSWVINTSWNIKVNRKFLKYVWNSLLKYGDKDYSFKKQNICEYITQIQEMGKVNLVFKKLTWRNLVTGNVKKKRFFILVMYCILTEANFITEVLPCENILI